MLKNKIACFTIVELLVIVIIVGIIAMLAVPTFFASRKKAQRQELVVLANLTSTAVRDYRFRENTVIPCTNSSACNLTYSLELDAVPEVRVFGCYTSWCVDVKRDNETVYINNTLDSPLDGNCTGHF